MTVRELVKIARELGVVGASKMKKAELEAAIEAAESGVEVPKSRSVPVEEILAHPTKSLSARDYLPARPVEIPKFSGNAHQRRAARRAWLNKRS